ncbi:hypothetical protein PG987_012376 [Apiospora arundinis]
MRLSMLSAIFLGLSTLIAALPTPKGNEIDVADVFKRGEIEIDVADAFRRDEADNDVVDAFKRREANIDVADAF